LGFLSKLFRQNQQNPGNPPPWSDFWFDNSVANKRGSTAGMRVNTTTAQRIAAVWACQTAIEESIAMLPATVFSEEDERNKVKLKDNPLYQLIRHAPNELMDSFTFFETMEQHTLSEGNAYAFIRRTRGGWIDQLLPLLPEKVRVEVKDNRPIYHYTDPNGRTEDYGPDKIFHLRYKSRDGVTGRSPIMAAAETFGVSMALLEHEALSFENGALMSGWIETPHTFDDEEKALRFLQSVKKYFGLAKTGGAALLEGGAKYNPNQMTNRNAQLLELMKASVLDIARIYRMPPVMIQVTESGMSYASVEQLQIIFRTFTVQPHSTRWERAIKFQLLNRPEERELFVRFNLDALVRGDLASRTNAIIQALQYGLKTINEGRNLLDENAYDHKLADEPMLSHNLVPISKFGETPAVPAQSQEQAPADSEDERCMPTIGRLEKRESWGKGESVRIRTEEESALKAARFRPLAEDLIGRLVRREQRAIRDAANKPDFMQRMEQFWKTHPTLIRDALEPVAIAWGARAAPLETFAQSYQDRRTLDLMKNQERALSADDSGIWATALLKMLEEEGEDDASEN